MQTHPRRRYSFGFDNLQGQPKLQSFREFPMFWLSLLCFDLWTGIFPKLCLEIVGILLKQSVDEAKVLHFFWICYDLILCCFPSVSCIHLKLDP